MINNISSNIIPHSLYVPLFIDMLLMNTKTQVKNVLAIVVSIAILTSIGSVTDINAHTPSFLNYGEIAQEDELYFQHDGSIYINAVPSQGNGLFMAITDIESEYTVNEALDRFQGIEEDTNSFVVEPSLYSNVGLVFQFNDETLTFQLLGAIEA